MNTFMNSLIESNVQCLGCEFFDRLFQIISNAAAAVYGKFVIFCVILFCIFFAFYIINAVWKNIKGGITDPLYQKSLKPLLINSLISLTFLSMGVVLPRFITTITFEPVSEIALIYTHNMLRTDINDVNEKVTYQPIEMSDDGFFRPQLRDNIIMLMKTTITQFQSYMKLGIAVMDKAFSLKALLGIGSLIKHIILFFIGFYLFYGFFKLFIRFCFYFIDIILAMSFFAFLFPVSLILVAFKGDDAPKWMSGLGGSIGTNQLKNLINAIVALVSAVLTYTIIMVIIAKFFSEPGQSVTEIMNLITQGKIFEGDLFDGNLATITIGGCVILVYVLNFIYNQIPQITSMIWESFGVSPKNDQLGDKLATDMMGLTTNVLNVAKNAGKNILNGGKKTAGDAAENKSGQGTDTETKDTGKK